MEITVSRKLVIALIAIVVLVIGAVFVVPPLLGRFSAATPKTSPSSDERAIIAITESLATAFGKGELYRFPEQFPVTARLLESIKKIPNRAETLPEYVGPAGEAMVVLRGTEASGEAFGDVSTHVLNKSVGGVGLTQVIIRFVEDGGKWKADRLYSIPKGDVQK